MKHTRCQSTHTHRSSLPVGPGGRVPLQREGVPRGVARSECRALQGSVARRTATRCCWGTLSRTQQALVLGHRHCCGVVAAAVPAVALCLLCAQAPYLLNARAPFLLNVRAPFLLNVRAPCHPQAYQNCEQDAGVPYQVAQTWRCCQLASPASWLTWAA